jgi:hypothetical protein
MAENKTTVNDNDVYAFLENIESEDRRKDALSLVEIFRQATAEQPKMWGTGIIGFGRYHYKYESGREGDFFIAGFSPRKSDFSIYLPGSNAAGSGLLARLGKYKTGKSCIYIRKLEDIQIAVLKQIIIESKEALTKSSHNSFEP